MAHTMSPSWCKRRDVVLDGHEGPRQGQSSVYGLAEDMMEGGGTAARRAGCVRGGRGGLRISLTQAVPGETACPGG